MKTSYTSAVHCPKVGHGPHEHLDFNDLQVIVNLCWQPKHGAVYSFRARPRLQL